MHKKGFSYAFEILVSIPIFFIAILLLYIGLTQATTTKQTGTLQSDISTLQLNTEFAEWAYQHPEQVRSSPEKLEEHFTNWFKQNYKVEDIDCEIGDNWVNTCEFELQKGKSVYNLEYERTIYLTGPFDELRKTNFRQIKFIGELDYE